MRAKRLSKRFLRRGTVIFRDISKIRKHTAKTPIFEGVFQSAPKIGLNRKPLRGLRIRDSKVYRASP